MRNQKENHDEIYHSIRVALRTPGDAAIAKAGELFDQGDIWQDSAEVPLLYDDFEEKGDAGIPLEFTVESEVTEDWPDPDASVKAIRHRDATFQAAHLLVEAYRHGEERGGSIDWDELDQDCSDPVTVSRYVGTVW